MLTEQRRLRLRALTALDREVKQFRIREDLFPLRIPHEPLLIDELLQQALGHQASRVDVDGLRSRTLLELRWPDGEWSVWLMALPSGLKLFCDSNGDESRVLASGGRNAGDESERLFLRLLCESGGAHFGLEMSGGAPTSVRTAVADRQFLIDLFVDLFEGGPAEHDIRAGRPAGEPPLAGRDFTHEVERWLHAVLAGGH